MRIAVTVHWYLQDAHCREVAPKFVQHAAMKLDHLPKFQYNMHPYFNFEFIELLVWVIHEKIRYNLKTQGEKALQLPRD